MAKKYKIQIIGIKTDADPNEVFRNLAALFKSSPDRIRTILKNKPAVIKSDISRTQADKYRTAHRNRSKTKQSIFVRISPIRKFVNRQHDGFQGIAVRSRPAGFSLTCD